MKLDIKYGDIYTRLYVVKEVSRGNAGQRRFLCECVCKNSKIVFIGDLRSGKTRSCGCLKRNMASVLTKTHGHSSVDNISRTYLKWKGMRTRCGNKNNDYYYRYGGRGITYDPRWEKFENFLEDMGEAPPNLSLDRVDNNGNYCKENCRWATTTEQARNKSSNKIICLNGKSATVAEWSEITGVPYHRLYERLTKLKWSPERALKN